MIPGWLISLLTFPGVIVHEIAHQFFCRMAKVAVLDVVYFQLDNPAGYVAHEIPKKPYQSLLISMGPLLVNTTVGAIIAFPASLPVFAFDSSDKIDIVLVWLGFSIAMHSFPSTGDAKSIWQAVMRRRVNVWYKVIAVLLCIVLYLGALGSVFWLDALYSLGVVIWLPKILFE